MNSNCNQVCRFCYNYKPPGPIIECCVPKVCATDEFLGSISSLMPVVNNSTRASERSLLLQNQQQFLTAVYTNNTNSTIQSTIQNSTMITSTLYGQLLQLQSQRALPYQPYVYPCVPQSVIDFQMATVNAGVPHSFFTIADCKGSQSVTT